MKETAIIVHVNFHAQFNHEDLEECQQLAASAGLIVLDVLTSSRQVPDAAYFIGRGKANVLLQAVKQYQPHLILFNHALSPAQARNLERLCQAPVVDRTDLILTIFADRARTFEGKLQVELAQLRRLSTRLVRGWTHLERQKGGIGLRGPGETQLETDRRLVRERIKTIEARLGKVKAQRTLSRQARHRRAVLTTALVGYTNAGKSTLFNRLTQADVYAADQLFATLDPTLRRVDIPPLGTVILADTVGFIRHLPADLIKAFQATLEEVTEADLLLHVVDATSQRRADNIKQVNAVLTEIGAAQIPCLMVFNKADGVEGIRYGLEWEETVHARRPKCVWISAAENHGIESLIHGISAMLSEEFIIRDLCLPVTEGRLRAALYRRKAVLAESIDHEGHSTLTIRLPAAEFEYIFFAF